MVVREACTKSTGDISFLEYQLCAKISLRQFGVTRVVTLSETYVKQMFHVSYRQNGSLRIEITSDVCVCTAETAKPIQHDRKVVCFGSNHNFKTSRQQYKSAPNIRLKNSKGISKYFKMSSILSYSTQRPKN